MVYVPEIKRLPRGPPSGLLSGTQFFCWHFGLGIQPNYLLSFSA